MRRAAGLLALAAALVGAGRAPQAPAPSAPSPAAPGSPPARAVVADIESGFEDRLKALDAADPFVLLGATSGVYLSGIGEVFTTPLDLIPTPQISPFHAKITPTEAAGVHKRKLAHLPLLRQALKDTVKTAAVKLATLAPAERIVFAARLYYFDWEDRSGLPSQIVATADRASALAGNIQLDEQQ